MKSTKFLLTLAILLFVIIIAMLWYLITTPAKLPATVQVNPANQHATTTTTTLATTTALLSKHIIVTTPSSHATVGQTFSVSGVAVNTWYFEAVFPIQVRDPDDNLIAKGQGQAQSDWTIEGPVPFTSTITLTTKYSGPADLILLRDNPSGLPQNDDEVIVPIIIK